MPSSRTRGWVDTSADEIDRQLWEIDENLIRSELTATETAEHLAKRKELWEARRESEANHPTLGGRGNKQFASETTSATGTTRQHVNRAVSRANGVTQEARDAIRGTDLSASHLTQVGLHAVITDGGNTITILDTDASLLSSSDFDFVWSV